MSQVLNLFPNERSWTSAKEMGCYLCGPPGSI